MKSPLEYGQKISDKRLLIQNIQETKKENDSYEIGSYGSGFRFAFPIIHENKYLGVFGVTFDEIAITSSIMKQYNVISNIVINDTSFNSSLLKEKNKYEKADFDGFLHNKKVLKDIQDKTKKTIKHLKPDEETSQKLYKQGQLKTANSLYIEENNSIVTTIPIIHKISSKNEAFISILSQGSSISILNSNYLTIFALFVFLYLAIFLLFLQQKIKILIDKKRIKQMIKKDKQLLEQAKMAQMGEMIGNIAHQWRQPLSAISTVASGVKLNHEFNMLKSEDIPKQMDLIVENTNYLSKTIDTFRDFIKEDKAQKDVSIHEVIDNSLKIVSASMKSHHIEVKKNIDYDTPVTINMIKGELSQALINILNNAKDALVQNEIENPWIKITQTQMDDILIIMIEDNAKGIKKELLTKIFDPYFTTKHQFQGTGLGLYMTKTIVENHLKGKLEVKNTKNGALFTISLKINTK